MGADMTIATFPAFRLNKERKARIMASLDHKRLADWDMEPDAVEAHLERLCAVATESDFTREALYMTEFDRKGAPMRVVMTGGMSWGESPTDLYGEITDFHVLCTNRSITLMDSYAKEDFRRTKKTGLPVKHKAKRNRKRGERC